MSIVLARRQNISNNISNGRPTIPITAYDECNKKIIKTNITHTHKVHFKWEQKRLAIGDYVLFSCCVPATFSFQQNHFSICLHAHCIWLSPNHSTVCELTTMNVIALQRWVFVYMCDVRSSHFHCLLAKIKKIKRYKTNWQWNRIEFYFFKCYLCNQIHTAFWCSGIWVSGPANLSTTNELFH